MRSRPCVDSTSARWSLCGRLRQGGSQVGLNDVVTELNSHPSTVAALLRQLTGLGMVVNNAREYAGEPTDYYVSPIGIKVLEALAENE